MKFGKIFLIFLALAVLVGNAFAINDYAYILKLDSYSTYPTTIYPNSNVSITLTLENISLTNDAKDIVLTMEPDNKYFEMVKAEDKINLIKFNQSGTLNLSLIVKPETPGGYYSLPLRINYYKDTIEQRIDTQVTLNIVNYDKINLVLTEYPKSKQYLDNTFLIKGFAKNEGNTTLKGISIKSEYVDSLIPLKEITQFLGDLKPTEQKAFEFEFEIPKVASTGVYDINVIAADIASHTDTEKVAVTIIDNPTLIISSIDKSIELNTIEQDTLVQGSNLSLSIQLENISESKAKSTVMEIKKIDEDIKGETIAYFGSIDPEDSGSGIFDLTIASGAKIGEHILDIEIKFNDEYDVEHSFTKQVSLYVNENGNGGSIWTYIIILLIIAGIAYYFYNKRKKKKMINE